MMATKKRRFCVLHHFSKSGARHCRPDGAFEQLVGLPYTDAQATQWKTWLEEGKPHGWKNTTLKNFVLKAQSWQGGMQLAREELRKRRGVEALVDRCCILESIPRRWDGNLLRNPRHSWTCATYHGVEVIQLDGLCQTLTSGPRGEVRAGTPSVPETECGYYVLYFWKCLMDHGITHPPSSLLLEALANRSSFVEQYKNMVLSQVRHQRNVSYLSADDLLAIVSDDCVIFDYQTFCGCLEDPLFLLSATTELPHLQRDIKLFSDLSKGTEHHLLFVWRVLSQGTTPHWIVGYARDATHLVVVNSLGEVEASWIKQWADWMQRLSSN